MFTAWPKDRTPARITADERSMVNSLLDFHRETALAKCEGLSDLELRATPIPHSPHSLIGILRHLTHAELFWSREVLEGRSAEAVGYFYGSEDNDPDFFNTSSHSSADVFTHFTSTVEAARAAMASKNLDDLFFSPAYGREVSGRFVHIHLLEEYARHLGHMDLLREALDGKIGY